MMSHRSDARDLPDRKRLLRRQAHDARNAQADKDQVSRRAIDRFMSLPEYQAARTVMWYVDCRAELRTRHALPTALTSDKRIVVPFCTTDESGEIRLGLWRLESMDELAVGLWGLLEPPAERWLEPTKAVQPHELDVVLVPGVGFDRHGARMGNGQGYYDRLLRQVRPGCRKIGICYASQLFDDLVVGPHDVYMDMVITQDEVLTGR
jgi:5-formyltetrahydrofolate cyclo-ligase